MVQQIIERRDREDWVDRLGKAGVPCGVVRSIAEVLESPEIAARGMLATTSHPTAGRLRLVAHPVKLSGVTSHPDAPPPLVGQHTDAILTGELGFTADGLADLRTRNIV